MPPKTSAHAQLDELRQQAANERMQSRDLEAQLEAAEDQLEDASQAITAGYANGDPKAVTSARRDEDIAIAAVKDLRHRFEGARLRVDRAQTELDQFLRERARDLLAEREPQARAITAELTASVHETLRLARAYVAERQAVDRLVAATPGASVRFDGPPGSHEWEAQLQALARVVSETPELSPPSPRWGGLRQRQEQDNVSRLEKLRRRKQLNEDEQHELDRLAHGRAVTPPVAMVTNDDAA